MNRSPAGPGGAPVVTAAPDSGCSWLVPPGSNQKLGARTASHTSWSSTVAGTRGTKAWMTVRLPSGGGRGEWGRGRRAAGEGQRCGRTLERRLEGRVWEQPRPRTGYTPTAGSQMSDGSQEVVDKRRALASDIGAYRRAPQRPRGLAARSGLGQNLGLQDFTASLHLGCSSAGGVGSGGGKWPPTDVGSFLHQRLT